MIMLGEGHFYNEYDAINLYRPYIRAAKRLVYTRAELRRDVRTSFLDKLTFARG